MRALFLQIVIVGLFLSLARAQEEVQAQSAQPEAPAIVPDFVLGQSTPYVPQTGENRNLVVGGFSVTGVFDDNAWGLTSDEELTLSSTIGFQQTRPHLQWNLSYKPGIILSRHLPQLDQFTQYVGGGLAYQLSPRFQVSVRQEYSASNDPFASVSGNQFLPAIGGPSATEASAVLAQYHRTTILSDAQMEYRLTARDTVGTAGSYSSFDYGRLDSNTFSKQLPGTQSTTAGAFYSHQFSAMRTAGIQYEYTDLRQDLFSTHSQIHRLTLFHQFTFRPGNTLAVFAGPEYAQSTSVYEPGVYQPLSGPASGAALMISDRGWDPTVGATYTWTGRHNALQLEYMRRVSSGGGIITAATTNTGSAGFYLQFTRNLTGQADVLASDSTSLYLGALNAWLRTITARVTVQRKLGENVSVSMDYARAWQDHTGLVFAIANDSRVEASLNYQFSRPLGR